MKKKLIVPVDLTPASKNAFLFAVELAKEFDLEIEIFPFFKHHAFVESTIAERFYGLRKVGMAREIGIFLEKCLEENDKRNIDLVINVNMIPLASLNSCYNDISMIVFGVESNNRYAYRMTQKKALELADLLDCDALFIPDKTTFRGFEQLLMVADYASVDIPLLSQLKEISEQFDSVLNFMFNVGDEKITDSQEVIYRNIFLNKVPDFSFEISFFNCSELEDAINESTKMNDIDLIVMNNEGSVELSKRKFLSENLNRPVLLPNKDGFIQNRFSVR